MKTAVFKVIELNWLMFRIRRRELYRLRLIEVVLNEVRG